jgi:hypothetical protein
MHSPPLMQPRQVLASQMGIAAGQSPGATQRTHAPEGAQTGVAVMAAHSLPVQPRQVPVMVLQMGLVPLHSRSCVHCTHAPAVAPTVEQ